MQGEGTALKLNLKIGIGLMIAFVMIMSGMTAIMSESGLNDSVTVSASGINNPTPTNTGCNVSYSQSSLQGNQIIANYTGDYLQIVNPGYYIVTMSCTNHNSNVFLSLNYNGIQTMQNSTYSIAQMGVNTSNGNGVIQTINFFWHDGTYHDNGIIALIVNSTNSNGQNSGSSNNLDTTPRVSMWPGKVNQHNWNGIWMTDPDGKSGGHPSTSYSNDYGDRKVDYCQKWWPNTYAVQLMPLRETITFYTAGNAVAYVSTKDVYECLIGNGTTPPAGNGTLPGSGNNTNPSNGNGTTPPAGNGTLPGSGNNTVNQEWIDFGFSNNHSNYVGVGESLEGEYSVGLMDPGVNYNVNLTVWRDNGTLFQTHSYVESTTFTSNDENAYGIYNNAEHSDWIPLAGGAPGQYNMDGDCFYAIAVLFGNGTYITETIYEFSVTTVDCDYHYNPSTGNNTGGNNTGGCDDTGTNNTGTNNTGGNNTGGYDNTGTNNTGSNNTNGTPPILLVTSDLPEEIEQTENEKLLNSGLEALSEAVDDLSLEQEAVLVSAGVGMTSFSLIGLISRYFSKGII